MDLLNLVAEFMSAHRVRAYLVGGTVRDQLLGRTETRDLDLAVDGDASALARDFANQYHGAFYLMDAEHNVARAIFDKKYVDVAQLRGDLNSDLATRDFTINAMARPLGTNEIVDPFGGQADLEARRIRAVSENAFRADPVRLLRAIRIAGELALAIEPETESWMRRDAALLAQASMERARDELFKILALPEVADLVRRMASLHMLEVLMPELTALRGVVQPPPHVYDAFEHSLNTVSELVSEQARGYGDFNRYGLELVNHFAQLVSAERTRWALLRFTALVHDIGKASTGTTDELGRIHFMGHEDRGAELVEPLLRRFRLSNDEIELVTVAIREHLRPANLARSPHVGNRAVYRFFRDAGKAGLDVCVLALADSRAKSAPVIDAERDGALRNVLATMIDRYFREPEAVISPLPLLDGRALMQALDLSPGPQVGELLESIREAQAAGEVQSREQAIEYAQIQLRSKQGAKPRGRNQ